MKPSTKLREIPSPTQPGSDAHALQISLLGAKAILFEAPGATDLPQQRRIWDLAQRLALTYSHLWKHLGAAPPLGEGAP